MDNFNKEILEGRRNAEMNLVRLLKKHRSWADVLDISAALWRVGFIADCMESERHMFHKNGGDTEVCHDTKAANAAPPQGR